MCLYSGLLSLSARRGLKLSIAEEDESEMKSSEELIITPSGFLAPPMVGFN